MTRIVLIDDHPALRSALAIALQREPDFDVVGEAGDAAEGLELLLAQTPDVALVDIAMPQDDGLSLLRECRTRGLSTKLLVMTMFGKETTVQEAFEAGASGFLSKSQDLSEVAAAIRSVAAGVHYAPPGMTSDPRSSWSQPRAGVGALSKREREILRLIVEGKRTKEIARDLFISQKTVETHRCSINRKLGVHSVGELMRFAAARGQLV